MAYSSTVQAKQCSNLIKLFSNGEHCDVKFIIGEDRGEFNAHRLLVSSISEVFKAMLCGNMKESEPNSEIEILDINADAFECILKHAYCNNPVLTADNILAVASICDKYQIISLMEVCSDAFESFVTSQSVCLLLSQSMAHKLSAYTAVLTALLTNMEFSTNEIVNSSKFLSISTDAMINFLKLDELDIKEENLWEAVLKWAEHQATNDECTEPSLKKRKLNDGWQILCEKVKPINCLTPQEMTDIFCYLQCNDEQCGNFSIVQREYQRRMTEYHTSRRNGTKLRAIGFHRRRYKVFPPSN